MSSISGFIGSGDSCGGGWESSRGYGSGVVDCRGSDGCFLRGERFRIYRVVFRRRGSVGRFIC